MALKCKATLVNGVGKCAVYDGTDEVFSDPFSDITRVKFHSDFNYISVTDTVTGQVTLPAVSAWTGFPTAPSSGQRYNTYQLFAHGLSEQPFVVGRILDFPSVGENLALSGSVPIQGNNYGFARWLTLGADETHVLLHEQTITHVDSGIAAITLDYEVQVSDLTVESFNGDAPGGEVLKITPNRMILGEGRFDSDKKYVKKATVSDEQMRLVGGKTIDIEYYVHNYGPGANFGTVIWKYSNGDYEYARTHDYFTFFGNPQLNSVNFTGDGVPVKT